MDIPDTTDLMSDRKTPVHGTGGIRHRTREVFRFMSPPRNRKVGWYVLVVVVAILILVELNRWTEGWVWEWSAWVVERIWNSNPLVPFVVGGFLFRYLWPLRERDAGDE